MRGVSKSELWSSWHTACLAGMPMRTLSHLCLRRRIGSSGFNIKVMFGAGSTKGPTLSKFSNIVNTDAAIRRFGVTKASKPKVNNIKGRDLVTCEEDPDVSSFAT